MPPSIIRPLSGPILAIESSCDETATAVLDPDGRVLAETVLSQVREHAPYGGVVPEIAARAHLAHLPGLVRDVLTRAGVAASDLGAVAASAGPGLIGGLIVGSQFAKGMALAHALPYVAVNHLEAHALTVRLPGLVEGGAPFPYLLLLVSGGHCQCVAVEGVGQYRRLGATVDDAAGEAFDKVAKLLGLGWPGGPELERLAARGDPGRFAFPRPMLGRPGCDFSFSGLKTAVAQAVARLPGALPAGGLPAEALPMGALPAGALPMGALPIQTAADLAASFQAAVTDVLADRASHAMAMLRGQAEMEMPRGQAAMEMPPGQAGTEMPPGQATTAMLRGQAATDMSPGQAATAMPPGHAPLLVVAGGVAANQAVRTALSRAAETHGFRLVAPPVRLCTDNAVMVGWAALERLRLGLADGLAFAPRPRWPLESMTA